MIIINEADIALLTDPKELVGVIVDAMKSHANGDFIMPDRSHVDMEDNTLLLMPAASGKYFGTKLVSLFPDNTKKNEPVLYGTVILNDGETGKPLALLNGAKLTAVRTAAVGAVGVKYTSESKNSTLGLIGAGVQGYHQVLFACAIRPIKRVCIFDAYHPDLNSFVSRLKTELPDVEFVISQNSEELCAESEIIITATNSTSPVLPDNSDLLEGKHVISIGSYKPEMIEVPDSLFSLVDDVYIDVEMAVDESGDLIQPMDRGVLDKSRIKLLSSIISQDSEILAGTSFFKSVGMALFDLFTAKYLYEKALEKNIGQKVDF